MPQQQQEQLAEVNPIPAQSLSRLEKTAGAAAIIYTSFGAFPVACHFVLGTYEAIEYLEKVYKISVPLNVSRGIAAATAVTSSINSFCVNRPHARHLITKAADAVQTYYSPDYHPDSPSMSAVISWVIGAPATLLTALASAGLSYGGAQTMLSLMFTNGIANKNYSIILVSAGFAGIDFGQTSATEGWHLITGLQKLPRQLQQTIYHLAQWRQRNNCRTISIDALRTALKYTLPLLFALIESSAFGFQFGFGMDNAEIMFKDLLGDKSTLAELCSYLKYPTIAASFLSCLFLQGKYLIRSTVLFEEIAYQKLLHVYHGARQLFTAAPPLSGCCDIQLPNCNQIINGLLSGIRLSSVIGLALWQAMASACLTFVSIEDLVNFWLLIRITIAIVDGVQPLTMDAMYVNEDAKYLQSAVKGCVAAMAEKAGCHDYIAPESNLSFTAETDSDEEDIETPNPAATRLSLFRQPAGYGSIDASTTPPLSYTP